jgi:hypothetical protein
MNPAARSAIDAAQKVAPPVRPAVTAPESPATPRPLPLAEGVPTEETLGLPVYPAAQFIASYDAGRGQRYYLFGTSTGFAEIVAYYKSVLRVKGEVIFDEPPVHAFDVGKFREDAMAFPPGVTVSDFTWGGSQGYLNPKPGGQPPRFPTIIQIVPLPPESPEAQHPSPLDSHA